MGRIKAEVDFASNVYPETQRIFLADGDALNLPTDKLTKIIEYLYLKFVRLERVASYAMPKNLLQKSDKDLDRLRYVGLTMFYLGIETGSDLLLKSQKARQGEELSKHVKRPKSTNISYLVWSPGGSAEGPTQRNILRIPPGL